MSKILQQNTYQRDQKKIKSQKQSQPTKNKSNDYIFKRYRYQQNTILDQSRIKEQTFKHGSYGQYNYENKQNELEKYKQELDNRQDPFDVIHKDWDQDQIEQETQENAQKGNNKTQRTQVKVWEVKITHQEPAKDPFLDRNENVNKCAQNNGLGNHENINGSAIINGSNDFDIKPMQLVDFQDEQEQQIYEGQEQCPSTCLTIKNTKSMPYPNRKNRLQTSDSQDVSLHTSSIASPSQSSLYPYSPNQTHDEKSIEESSSMSLKHDKNYEKHATLLDENLTQKNNHLFSPRNTQLQKFQINKLAEDDNPFKDAVDYSTSQDQLKGIKIHSVVFEQDVTIQIVDKELFISSKIPPGIILKCKLKRSAGFFSLMSPQFDLYLQNGLKHLISAKKNTFRNRELFQLSTQISNFDNPIRNLMANVLHNTFWLVDQPRVIDRKKISYLDLLIQYRAVDANLGRQMLVLCPPALKSYHIGLEYDIPCVDFQWFKKNISLKLHNYQHSSKSSKKSQKNFSLIDSDEQSQQQQHLITKNTQKKDTHKMSKFNFFRNQNHFSKPLNQTQTEQSQKYFYLKMQKQSQNIFDVQIQHPLTPLQAMAIILTRFDAQLK